MGRIPCPRAHLNCRSFGRGIPVGACLISKNKCYVKHMAQRRISKPRPTRNSNKLVQCFTHRTPGQNIVFLPLKRFRLFSRCRSRFSPTCSSHLLRSKAPMSPADEVEDRNRASRTGGGPRMPSAQDFFALVRCLTSRPPEDPLACGAFVLHRNSSSP